MPTGSAKGSTFLADAPTSGCLRRHLLVSRMPAEVDEPPSSKLLAGSQVKFLGSTSPRER